MLKNNKHDNIHLQRAWNKHGEENFKFEIVKICHEDELIECEQWYLDNANPTYNISKLAGGGAHEWTDEMRKKVSDSHKGRKLTEEQRKKWSEVKLGKPNYSSRIPVIQYTLEGAFIKLWDSAVSASLEAKTNPDLINRVASTGKGVSGGFRWSRVGNPPSIVTKRDYTKAYGKENKMGRRPVSQYSLDDKWIKDFDGLITVKKELGIDQGSVLRCIKGKQKTAGGFIWKRETKS